MNQPIQGLKVEPESIKKTQAKANVQLKHLGTPKGTTKIKFHLGEYKKWKRESKTLKAQ